MLNGIDFSFGNGVTVAEIKAAGAKYVGRYLTGLDGNTKDIDAAELENYLKADLPVIFVFETAGQEFTEAQGATDARAAQAQLDSFSATVGVDVESALVYFAQDLPEAAGVSPVAYMKGAASVLGVDRTGVYGNQATCTEVIDAGHVAKLANGSYAAWATAVGAGVDSRAVIRQVRFDFMIGKCNADVDNAAFYGSKATLTAGSYFGQFPKPVVKVAVPSLVGLDLADALAEVTKLGLKFDANPASVPDGDSSKITAQSPAAGTLVVKDSVVTVTDVAVLPKGDVAMPQITGLDLAAARKALAAVGLAVSVTGKVASQSVQAGDPVKKGSVVEVTL